MNIKRIAKPSKIKATTADPSPLETIRQSEKTLLANISFFMLQKLPSDFRHSYLCNESTFCNSNPIPLALFIHYEMK